MANLATSLAISLLLWPLMAAIPFLPLSVKGRAIAGGALFVILEILFWGGAIFAGKEAAQRYRDKLDPRTWFRK